MDRIKATGPLGDPILVQGENAESVRKTFERIWQLQLSLAQPGAGQESATEPEPVAGFGQTVRQADVKTPSDRLLMALWWLSRNTGVNAHKTQALTALCRKSNVKVGANPTATLSRMAAEAKRWLHRGEDGWSLTEVGERYATELATRPPGKLLNLPQA